MAKSTARWLGVVPEDGLRRNHRFAHPEPRSPPPRSLVERIRAQRLVFGLSPFAISAHLLQKPEFHMQVRVGCLRRIGRLGLEQQAHRAFAGGAVTPQRQLRPCQSFIARTR